MRGQHKPHAAEGALGASSGSSSSREGEAAAAVSRRRAFEIKPLLAARSLAGVFPLEKFPKVEVFYSLRELP